MEGNAGMEGHDIKSNVLGLLYDGAKALRYSDHLADQIRGDRLVNQPIFSRKRDASRAPHAGRRT